MALNDVEDNDLETPLEEFTPHSDSGVPHHHEHQQSVVNRLARIEGHVKAIKRMVAEDTPCPEVLVQIAAVRAALSAAGRILLEDHMQSCMLEAVEKGDYNSALRDLKNSLDRFIS